MPTTGWSKPQRLKAIPSCCRHVQSPRICRPPRFSSPPRWPCYRCTCQQLLFFRRVFRLLMNIRYKSLPGYPRWLWPKIKHSSLGLQGTCLQHGWWSRRDTARVVSRQRRYDVRDLFFPLPSRTLIEKNPFFSFWWQNPDWRARWGHWQFNRLAVYTCRPNTPNTILILFVRRSRTHRTALSLSCQEEGSLPPKKRVVTKKERHRNLDCARSSSPQRTSQLDTYRNVPVKPVRQLQMIEKRLSGTSVRSLSISWLQLLFFM